MGLRVHRDGQPRAHVLCARGWSGGVPTRPVRCVDPTPYTPPGTAWGSGTLTEPELGLLVSQMTLAEKDAQLHGSSDSACASAPLGCWGQAGWIPGVARLGIPPLRLTDGPAGVRLGHVETAMPAPVGLAATFDRNASQLFGKSVGVAGRASNQDVWLAPMINAVNYVTGGRNFETLGEDPYLASELVATEVKGVQGEGLIAQIKHYITNDFENGRNSTSVKVDPQTFHENSLPAFEAGVKAGAGSAMCSYNRINDVYGCGNDYTLNQVLKGELGFKGFVTSDWGATHRTTDIISGLDMEQSGSSNLGQALINAATNGTDAVPVTNDYPAQPAFSAGVWLVAMDSSVLRILRSMNSAGLGLSYTTFAYSNLHVAPVPDGGATVTFDVRNTGTVRGDEVPQVYVGAGPDVPGVQQAVKALRGFERIALNPGTTRRMSIKLDPRSFQYWSATGSRWVTNYGPRTVWVGGASDELPLSDVTGAGVIGIGGTVPEVLSLGFGTPASFGLFTPGVARDYTASMAATVTSTAGDAALTVFDPTGVSTGRLVHTGGFSLTQPLFARAGTGAFGALTTPQTLLTYSGPVTNDAATVDFKQSIGAAEPLRSGAYGKTLTFTLSTTTP